MIKRINPPLKWAGGKRWLVPHIQKYFLPYINTHRLVEPFAGGLAVALGLAPKRALLNDINPHLINFYIHLQKGISLDSTFKNDSKLFYELRDEFNKTKIESKRAAQLFYYLNRTCFNGLCRFNNKGEFNVPFGRYKKIDFNKDLGKFKHYLKCWRFKCGGFEEIKIQKNDFLYVDPPYDVQFTQYSKDGFNWEDQKRLVRWLAKLKTPMIVSNQATTRILKLYKSADFRVTVLEAPRRISADGNRKPAQEMLAYKNITI